MRGSMPYAGGWVAEGEMGEAERYRLLVEEAPVGIALFVDGEIAFANRVALGLLGAGSAGELIGIPLADVVHPDDWPTANARMQQLLAGDARGYPVVERYLRRDGSVAVVEVSASALTLEEGPAIQVVMTDLGERERAAGVRGKAEERFTAAFMTSPVGLTISRVKDGTLIDVNDAFLDMFGFTREEAIGCTSTELNLISRSEREQKMAAWVRSGDRAPLELAARAKSGEVVNILLSVRSFETNGEACYITTMIDIRTRLRAEQALRSSEARFRATFEHAAVGIAHVAIDGRFLRINQTLCDILGYSHEELVGRSFQDVTHPDDLPVGTNALRRMLAGELDVFRVEKRYVRKDGELVWIHLTSVLVSDPSDGANYFVSVVQDIAARKRAEAEREELAQQVVATQKMDSIGRLAGGVAHDFNNMLAVIICHADLASHALHVDDPIRADIREVQNAAERAATLTRQLLAFSRRQLLVLEVVSLNNVVAGIESMLRRLLGEGIEVELTLAEDLANTVADAGQLEQVIMNLALNARDAMPGGGRLSIETYNVDVVHGTPETHAVESGQFAVLSVSDTGSGMDEQTRSRVFEPFFTTKEKGKGTGLGLSTVYGVVQQIGGTIVVVSEPGRGTTFRVYLPRVDASAVPAEPAPTARPAGGSEVVLLVEDQDAVRRIAARILRAAGYEVVTATDGLDALRQYEDCGRKIDLLLTDVAMPRMGGPELAARMAELSPGLRVVYMSGYSDDLIEGRDVVGSGVRVIGKPFTPDELTRKVREALDRR